MESIVAGIIGFLLAEIVNVAKVIYNEWRRAKLTIESVECSNRLLSHSTQFGNRGEWGDEVYYGFEIRNRGKRIASRVRSQLVKIEIREGPTADFCTLADTALDLFTYAGANRPRASVEATIVPGTGVLIALAWWRQDFDAVMPLVDSVPDYYEDTCKGTTEYRFTVVAFDDNRYSTLALIVRPDGRSNSPVVKNVGSQ